MPRIVERCASDRRIIQRCPDPRIVRLCGPDGPIFGRYTCTIDKRAFLAVQWAGECGGSCSNRGGRVFPDNWPDDNREINYLAPAVFPALFGIDSASCETPSNLPDCGEPVIGPCGFEVRCYRNQPDQSFSNPYPPEILAMDGCLRISGIYGPGGSLIGFRLSGGFYVMLERIWYFGPPEDLWNRRAGDKENECCYNYCNPQWTYTPLFERDYFGIEQYTYQFSLQDFNPCNVDALVEQIGFVGINIEIYPPGELIPDGLSPQDAFTPALRLQAYQNPDWWRSDVDMQWGGGRGDAAGLYYINQSGPFAVTEWGTSTQQFVPEHLFAPSPIGEGTPGNGIAFVYNTTWCSSCEQVPTESYDCVNHPCNQSDTWTVCKNRYYYCAGDTPPQQVTNLTGSYENAIEVRVILP